jgi:hypothetical protein
LDSGRALLETAHPEDFMPEPKNQLETDPFEVARVSLHGDGVNVWV